MPNTIKSIARTHPFSSHTLVHWWEEGITVQEILDNCDIDTTNSAVAVGLNGELLNPKHYDSIKPKPNSELTIKPIPQGGGGGDNKVVSTVLSIAVMTAFGGASLGTHIFGNSTSAAGLAAGLTDAAALFAVNSIFGPQRPSRNRGAGEGSGRDDITQTITGSQNRANRYGAIPKVYGKTKLFPPYAAQPVTESQGTDQYLRMLFAVGYGPLKISDIKIGETSIDEFDNVEKEVREGFDDDDPRELYTNDFESQDLNIGLTENGGSEVRTTNQDVDEISLDISFEQGLTKFLKGGGRENYSVELKLEYRGPETSGYEPIPDRVDGNGKITITNNMTSLFRENFRWDVENGQYDIRITRLTKSADDLFDQAEADRVRDKTKWTKLRSIRHQDPIQFDKNIATIALRIKATDQLNGIIDKLSCIAHSVLPNYDGNDWSTEEKTNNNASIFRDMLLTNAHDKDITTENIDEPKIEEFHTYCKNNNFTFNGVYDEKDTLWGAMHDVLSSARGSRTMKDGNFSVVFDEKKNAPVQHFTPRNTFDFNGKKQFTNIPHALKIQFRNENQNYEEDERIVYDDGYGPQNATDFQDLKYFGVTDPEQIYKLGRYNLALMRLRPEKFEFKTDVEHIVCSRGDKIRFTHDVPQLGQNSGRITAVNVSGTSVTSVDIDSKVDMDEGTQYGVRIRNADSAVETSDSSIFEALETTPNQSGTLTFEDPIPNSDPQPDVGDLFQFGLNQKESLELLVEEIEPRQHLEAKITCTNYNEAILDAAAGEIPDFDSQITPDGPLQKPVIDQIRSTIDQTDDGSFILEMVISMEDDLDLLEAESLEVQFKEAKESRWRSWDTITPPKSQFVIDPATLQPGRTYNVRARKISELGLTSPWTQKTHKIVGRSGPPSDVENFDADLINGSAYLSWDAVEDEDATFYRIKHSKLLDNAVWGDAQTLVNRVPIDSTSTQVPAITGTYMIKAFDIEGLKSKNEARAETDVASIRNLNVVANLQEDSDFVGSKTNMLVMEREETGEATDDTPVLTLNGSDQVKDWDNLTTSNIPVIAYGESGIYQSGTYNFDSNPTDLGSVYTSRLSANVEVTGQNVGNLVKLWDTVGDIQEVGAVDPSDYDINLQERHTEDDPNISGTNWSSWSGFSVGDIKARAFEFRLKPTTDDNTIRPKFDKVRVSIDMPDQSQGENDIAIPASGTRVSFDKPFNSLEGLAITIDDSETGDYPDISNKDRKGFDITVRDSNDNGAAREIDYVAKGFGVEL